MLLGADDPALAETERLNEQGLRVLLLARTTGDLDDPEVAHGASAAALVVLEQRLRPDAADTLRTSPSRTSVPRSSPVTTRCRWARWPENSA